MANMVPEWTTADLWRRLADGRLLEPHALDRQRERLASIDDVREALKHLLAAGELTTWQANQLLAGREDFAVGNYLLVNQVGQDEIGKHFLARHAQLGRNVLLKIVHRHLSKNDQVIQRFVQDAREAGALEHPNILHVFDVDQDRGRCFMVSEYCAGESLKSLVERDEALPMEAVVSYIMQAAEALRYAHGLGVSHQHLQATHLLLSQQVIKIADFGVGELAASLAPNAESAEQDHQQAVRLHAAQDVAALGRIFLFLLDAADPSATASQTLRRLAQEMLHEPWTERIRAEAVHAACRRWLDEHHASQPVAPAPKEEPPAAHLASAAPPSRENHSPDAVAAKPAPPRKPARAQLAAELPVSPSRSAIGRKTKSVSAVWIVTAVLIVGVSAALWLAFQPPIRTSPVLSTEPVRPPGASRGDDPLSGVGGRASGASQRPPHKTAAPRTGSPPGPAAMMADLAPDSSAPTPSAAPPASQKEASVGGNGAPEQSKAGDAPLASNPEDGGEAPKPDEPDTPPPPSSVRAAAMQNQLPNQLPNPLRPRRLRGGPRALRCLKTPPARWPWEMRPPASGPSNCWGPPWRLEAACR